MRASWFGTRVPSHRGIKASKWRWKDRKWDNRPSSWGLGQGVIERIGHIRNPLTVIAIFAAVAEVSGVGVLPFISPENQAVYIWFLMLFPVILVVVFFLTLNFNQRVLYAPSDWKDERHFYGLTPATPEEVREKHRDDLAEGTLSAGRPGTDAARAPIRSEGVEEASPTYTTSIRIGGGESSRFLAAERLALSKLSSEINRRFDADVAVTSDDVRIVVDGYSASDARVDVAEIQFNLSGVNALKRVNAALRKQQRLADLVGRSGKEFLLHFIVVYDAKLPDKAESERLIAALLAGAGFPVKLHVFTMSELGLPALEA